MHTRSEVLRGVLYPEAHDNGIEKKNLQLLMTNDF